MKTKLVLAILLLLCLPLLSSGQLLLKKKSIGALPTGAFTPASIPEVKLWLPVDYLSLSDNDPAGTWTDYSGNGKHATATGSARPTFKTGVINGKPVLRFDGVDDVMSGSSVFSATPVHVFAVASMVEQTLGILKNVGVLWEQVDAATDYIAAYRDGGVAGNTTKPIAYNGANLAGSVTATNTFYLWEFLFDGASSKVGTNGIVTTGDAGSLTPAGSYYVAKWEGGGQFHQWDIAEIVACDSAITGSTYTALTNYFHNKYGVP